MEDVLKPWYEIAIPHEDIRDGKLDEAIFAANIWAVVCGNAPDVYLNPETFFKKTYMTLGLSNILKRVANGLNMKSDAGDRIISLQTSFGGGKTHTLVALWHLAKNFDKLKKSNILSEIFKQGKNDFPEKVKGIAVFTNATCDSTNGRTTTDGINIKTLWGEIAYQLGGRKLYEKIKQNDQQRSVPQGIFIEVLKEASPCLILIDELADYCVGASSIEYGKTTLADQTISFIQHLTEAVQQVPGAVVVATLPASAVEVAQSEKGQEAFTTLEKRFQRLGADLKPVADDEIYEVIKRRLFESITPPDKPDYPDKVSEAYYQMYVKHSNDLPVEASKSTYKEQIKKAYPFHPLMIDALYLRWSNHPDFQKTRGVLRLLASIIGDLWKNRNQNHQTQHLIQPCHIRWTIDAMNAALTRYWGATFQSVIAADVIGEKSNSTAVDEERGQSDNIYKQEKIAEGMSAAMLLGSFGGQSHSSGFSTKDLKLACAKYGLNWNYIDGVLLQLEEMSFYLRTTQAGSLGKRYWYGTKPTITKLLIQYKQQLTRNMFEEEILEAINEQTKKISGSNFRIIVNPDVNLSEQKSLSLIILPPTYSCTDDSENNKEIKKYIMDISLKCAAKERIYRNTLLYLGAYTKGLNKLRNAYREKIALEAIQADYFDQLDAEQKTELQKKLDVARKNAFETLGPAYPFVFRINGHEPEPFKLSDAKLNFSEHISFLWESLKEEEWVLSKIGPVMLQKTGIVGNSANIRVKDAIDSFLRFTDKPMITNKDAVTQGISQACKDGLIGIGYGLNANTMQKKICRESISIDASEDGVWIIPPYEPEVEKPKSITGDYNKGTSGITPPTNRGNQTPSGGNELTSGSSLTPTVEKDKIRIFSVNGSVPVESYGDLFRCFVAPAVRLNLKKFKINVSFDVELHEGQELSLDENTIKTMKEAAKQLGLKFDVVE